VYYLALPAIVSNIWLALLAKRWGRKSQSLAGPSFLDTSGMDDLSPRSL
jgi:hypothetical protein